MRTDRRQFGMTLVEVLVSLAIILILVAAMGGLGVHLKRQSEIRLTESTLEVLGMALEQYFADYSAYVPQVNSQAEFNSKVGVAATTIVPPAAHLSGVLEGPAWSGEALYYFLNRCPNSAAILSALMDLVISSKDAAGRPLLIEIPTGGTRYDLIRFVDAWGTPIRYAYDPARDQFPILTSAGPDKRFDTASDNITSQ